MLIEDSGTVVIFSFKYRIRVALHIWNINLKGLILFCCFIPDGEIWICKPTGMNQGKGIYLVNSREQLIEKLNMNGGDDCSARRSQMRPPQGRVIQRYSLS